MLSNKMFLFQETTNQNLYIYRLEITGCIYFRILIIFTGCIYFRISIGNFPFFFEMKEIISGMWKIPVVFHGRTVLGCQCELPSFSGRQLDFLRPKENTEFATILGNIF